MNKEFPVVQLSEHNAIGWHCSSEAIIYIEYKSTNHSPQTNKQTNKTPKGVQAPPFR